MTTTQVAPLGLRLFLEGVEVPVISAQVVVEPGKPAAASIQIIPTDSALLFLPRTLVHLFFLDEHLTDDDRSLLDKLDENKVDRFDVEDERYRLLYCGEVTGLRFVKTPTNRSLVLQSMDLSSYWDTCYQWFADYSVGGGGFTDLHHNFIGAGQGLFDNIASGTRWTIGNIITSAPENPEYQGTQGLLAGLIHLLEAVGGLKPKAGKDGYNGKRGVNDFFTIAELRYNLTGMIGAVAADKTSGRMFAHKAFLNWLESGMASAGSLITFRNAVKLVGEYIFHDIYPNPVARYVKGGEKKSVEVLRSYKIGASGPKITEKLQSALTTLVNVRTALTTTAPLPGASSVRIDQDTGRTPIVESLKLLEEASVLLGGSGAQNATQVRAEVDRIKVDLGNFLLQFRARSRQQLGEVFDVVFAGNLGGLLNPIVDALESVLDVKTATKKVPSEVTTSDHLYNQLILPETFFVAPPKCNVIFPDQVENFQWTRNFMREVSRLSCQGGLGIISRSRGFSRILGRHYFAPNIRDAEGKIARRVIYSSGTTILPHEIHSGIIPKMEWVTHGHRWGIKAAKESQQAKSKKEIEEAKISYIQRLANFQFFIHRWSARTMAAKLRFSPQLVLGFPGVVIDRSAPSPGAIEAMSDILGTGRAILPTAFLGKVASISHDVNQAGGGTQVAFTQARTHRGIDDEFLGVLARERRDIEAREVPLVVEDLVAQARAGGVSREQLTLIRRYIEGTLKSGLRLDSGEKVGSVVPDPNYVSITFDELVSLNIPIDSIERLYDQQVNQPIDDPDSSGPTGLYGASTFIVGSVSVPKVVTVTIEAKTDLGKFVTPEGSPAPEVILKPGWYSDVWSPEQISEDVYAPLLGTLSITDDETVASGEGIRDLSEQLFKSYGYDTVSVQLEGEDEGVKVTVDGQEMVAFDLATSNVERAIDGLTMLYAQIKKQDLNAQEFIRQYTRRPIATIPDVLGTKNLQFNSDGTVQDPSTMVEGFHSRAFGPYNTNVKHRNDSGERSEDPVPGDDAMQLLVPEDRKATFNLSLADKGKELGDIQAYLDPRGRAQQRVRAYAAELAISRGLLAT